jgi:hypothetical protein
MSNLLTRAALVAIFLAMAGCSSHGGGSPDMETRLYRLRDPDADARVVNRVLETEYERSGVRSSSSVTPGGDIMVQTTPRGHAAVREALGREGRAAP